MLQVPVRSVRVQNINHKEQMHLMIFICVSQYLRPCYSSVDKQNKSKYSSHASFLSLYNRNLPTMAPFASILHEFHGFVDLNNHGVTLLEQGQYLYATEAFIDALATIKYTLSLLEDEDSETLSSSASDDSSIMTNVNSRVQKALSRTLQPMNDDTDTNECERSSADLTLRVLTHSVQGIEATNPNSDLSDQNEVVLIQIDVDDPSEYSSALEIALDVNSAVILHNMGVATLCMACRGSNCTSTSIESIRKLFLRAINYLELSQRLLQDNADTNNVNGINAHIDLQVYNGILQTESIVLQSLIAVQQALGHDADAPTERLSDLLQMRREMEARISLVFHVQSLNAAAA
jgi:hypothetical protein